MRLPRAVLLLALLTGRYLHWRITPTLNLSTPLASTLRLLLLAAELWLLTHGLLQLFFTLAPETGRDEEIERAATALERRCRTNPDSLPWVDVLVHGCGEPLEVVERSLRGCRAIAYPHRVVWLLDDTARQELARLCRQLGVRYRSRERRDHAKAGNLNHVLPELRGDLLAVFDNGHSRTALTPELYRWVMVVPLAGVVIDTLLGRQQAFHVTPKALATGGVAPAPSHACCCPCWAC